MRIGRTASRQPRAGRRPISAGSRASTRALTVSLVVLVATVLATPGSATAAEPGEPGNLVYYEGGPGAGAFIAGPTGAHTRAVYSKTWTYELPVLSPNGQSVLVNSNSEKIILVNAFDKHETQTVLAAPEYNENYGTVRWAPNGRSFYYLYKGNPPTQPAGIYLYSLESNTSTRIAGWSSTYSVLLQSNISVAANGTLLFSSTVNPKGESLSAPTWWTVNSKGEEATQVLTKYAKASSIIDGSISPNGKEVVFSNEEANVVTTELNGSGAKTLVKATTAHHYYEPSWSPNGSLVLYVQVNSTSPYYSIDRISTSGGKGEVLITAGPESGMSEPSYRQASTLTATQIMALTLRPNLYFDTGEPWRPLNVEDFLSEKNSLGEALNYVCHGGGTCYPLTEPSALNKTRTSESFIDIKGDYKTEGKSAYHSPISECVVHSQLDCNSGPRSAIYYHVVGPHEGYTYIDYWIFYRFNLYSEVVPESLAGNHEGDWESVTIAPSSTGETFDFASFSQHGTWYSYLRFAMACEGETKIDTCGGEGGKTEGPPTGVHVSVFPAWGDHANYPETCSSLCEETGSPVPENEHDGKEPWGNNAEPEALIKLPETGKETWVDWPGVWGNESQASPELPPMSPGNQKPHFTEPWRSECEKTGEGSCTLTASAGRLLAHPASQMARSGLAALTDATNTPGRTGLGADEYCANWFGTGIQALLCNPTVLSASLRAQALKPTKSLTFAPAPISTVADAPGLVQAAGATLSPGQHLFIRGHVRRGTVLFVRARSGEHRVEARFAVLPEHSGSEVEVLRAGAVPEIRLVGPDGQTVRPSLVIRSTLK
jgi:Tol biopolymer transport system component